MGLFDWFRGPPTNVTVLPDVIWLTKSAKLDGLAKTVSEALAGPEPPDAVLLVAHFRDCLDDLQKLVDGDRIAGPVGIVSAGDLGGRTAGMSLDESRKILIVVCERHPLRTHDDGIGEFAAGLPCRSRLVHHVSLDDPLMKASAGAWVTNTLRNLGMKEDAPIESPMVARRIKAAQDKLADRCRSDHPADSAEAWMERNCPEA